MAGVFYLYLFNLFSKPPRIQHPTTYLFIHEQGTPRTVIPVKVFFYYQYGRLSQLQVSPQHLSYTGTG